MVEKLLPQNRTEAFSNEDEDHPEKERYENGERGENLDRDGKFSGVSDEELAKQYGRMKDISPQEIEAIYRETHLERVEKKLGISPSTLGKYAIIPDDFV
jgi:hypothetical protein